MNELTPAPEGYPIKLVRDKTAEIINSSGRPGDLFYGRLTNDTDLGPLLRRKLIEETAEYVEEALGAEGGLAELCDVLAVVEGLAVRKHGIALEELITLMRSDPRGGFLEGVMMYGHHSEFDR